MCSWCWAYRPTLNRVLESVSQKPFDDLTVKHLVGGLAPDSDAPMPADMAAHLQGVWQRIQTVVPGTEFNFEFWTRNVPRRSTWQSCRAVLAAESLGASGSAMTEAIQRAYYLDARNPSDTDVLVSLAGELGLDEDTFRKELNSASTEAALQRDFAAGRALGARGFPSLFLHVEERGSEPIPVDYKNADTTLSAIRSRL